MKRYNPGKLPAALLAVFFCLMIEIAPGFAQSCPAGMRPTGDGYCLAANQSYCGNAKACSNGLQCRTSGPQAGRCFYANGCYPDQARGPSACVQPGYFSCANGGQCRHGQTCMPNGKCAGGALGAYTPDGGRCSADHQLTPSGECYDPALQKLCGQAACDLRDECDVAKSLCLAPFKQVNATPQVRPPTVAPPSVQAPAPPTVTPPGVKAPASPTVTPPNVQAPASPTVTPPSVQAPASPTVTPPGVQAPAPPTVTAPNVRVPAP